MKPQTETSLTGERLEVERTTRALLELVTTGSVDVAAARARLEVAEIDGLEVERLCDRLRNTLVGLVELAEGRPHTEKLMSELLAVAIGAGIKAGLAVGHLQEALRTLGGFPAAPAGRFDDCIARPKRKDGRQ